RTAPPHAHTLALHDALPICGRYRTGDADSSLHCVAGAAGAGVSGSPVAAEESGVSGVARRFSPVSRRYPVSKSVLIVLALGLLRSEEHTSELQSRENLVCRL